MTTAADAKTGPVPPGARIVAELVRRVEGDAADVRFAVIRRRDGVECAWNGASWITLPLAWRRSLDWVKAEG